MQISILSVDGVNFSCLYDAGNDKTEIKVMNAKENQLPEIPNHLKEQFDQSSKEVNDNQKQRLASLLVKYQDTFAKSKNELGK